MIIFNGLTTYIRIYIDREREREKGEREREGAECLF